MKTAVLKQICTCLVMWNHVRPPQSTPGLHAAGEAGGSFYGVVPTLCSFHFFERTAGGGYHPRPGTGRGLHDAELPATVHVGHTKAFGDVEPQQISPQAKNRRDMAAFANLGTLLRPGPATARLHPARPVAVHAGK